MSLAKLKKKIFARDKKSTTQPTVFDEEVTKQDSVLVADICVPVVDEQAFPVVVQAAIDAEQIHQHAGPPPAQKHNTVVENVDVEEYAAKPTLPPTQRPWLEMDDQFMTCSRVSTGSVDLPRPRSHISLMDTTHNISSYSAEGAPVPRSSPPSLMRVESLPNLRVADLLREFTAATSSAQGDPDLQDDWEYAQDTRHPHTHTHSSSNNNRSSNNQAVHSFHLANLSSSSTGNIPTDHTMQLTNHDTMMTLCDVFDSTTLGLSVGMGVGADDKDNDFYFKPVNGQVEEFVEVFDDANVDGGRWSPVSSGCSASSFTSFSSSAGAFHRSPSSTTSGTPKLGHRRTISLPPSFSLTPREHERFQALFELLDSDHDGLVSLSDLCMPCNTTEDGNAEHVACLGRLRLEDIPTVVSPNNRGGPDGNSLRFEGFVQAMLKARDSLINTTTAITRTVTPTTPTSTAHERTKPLATMSGNSTATFTTSSTATTTTTFGATTPPDYDSMFDLDAWMPSPSRGVWDLNDVDADAEVEPDAVADAD